MFFVCLFACLFVFAPIEHFAWQMKAILLIIVLTILSRKMAQLVISVSVQT